MNISEWKLAPSGLCEECWIDETHRVAVPLAASKEEKDKEIATQIKEYEMR